MGKPLDIKCFVLKNENGQTVIYRTSDPSRNLLTFTIINATEADLKLKGGAPGVGSTFTIDFSSILPDPIVEGLAIALPAGWDKHFEPGSETELPAWALAPVADLTLKPGDSVKFEISKIVLDSYDSGNFEIQWSNVPGQSDSPSPLTIWVGIINPPDPKKKDLLPGVVHYGYKDVSHTINNPKTASEMDGEVVEAAGDETPVEVFITYDAKALIFNGFTYYLTNYSDDKIPADTTPGAGTVLSISFLVGPLSYDITTPERATNQMAMVVTSKDPPWKLDSRTSSEGLVTFIFKPSSNIFLGAKQTLTLDVQAIITALNVDPGTISTMYAQINNVPGYNDTVFPQGLQKKVAVASAAKITATPTTIDYGKNVTLSWETKLAKRATIEYKDRKKNSILLDSDKGDIQLSSNGFVPKTPPSAATTVFLLSAYDNSPTPSQMERSVTVIEPPPAILSFSSDRSLVEITGKTDITLSWKLNDNVSKLLLDAPDGVHDVTNQSSYPYKITASVVFKLQAYGYDPAKPDPVAAKTTVFAYRAAASMSMNFTGVWMQTWPVVLASRANNCVFALDAGANMVYKFDASTGVQLDTYAGAAMAMSPKETKLFVFNTNAAAFGVSMVDIRSRAVSPPISFGPVAAMVSNDSDTLLFCASRHKMNLVWRVAIDAPGNRLTLAKEITVGTTPISMVFNDDSTMPMLYVANYDSKSISSIRISDNSVGTVNLDTTGPNSMVYQKALKRLFVACEGEDKIAMIQLPNNAVTYIKTGHRRPSQLLFNLNQEILYVANFGDNTVTLIDAVGGAVKSTLTVGEGPIGMALNGDCNLLFVCNYCSRTLSVIDLLGNYVLPDQLPTGKDSGNAFGLAVFLEGNDYAKVFVGKENFPDRRTCGTPSPNTSLSVAAFSIQKPGTRASL